MTTTTSPAATALHLLRASRDAEHDAPIWTDGGETVERLARTASVRVVYAHCDLTAQATEFRTVDGAAGGEGGAWA